MSGSIKANKIKAKNVVAGVQIQGEAPKNLKDLKDVAAAYGGKITADEIDAESIISGLQLISGKTPESSREFRDKLVELTNLVQRLVTVVPAGQTKDVQEMSALLEKSKQELTAKEPSANRISRWLKSVNEIASNVKTNVTTFTAVAKAAQKLVEVIGLLIG